MIDLTKLFSFLVTIYITATIVFKQNYVMVTYIIDALLIGLFVFYFYIIGERKKIKTNPIIIAYTLFTIFALSSSLWAISFDLASYRSLQLFLIVINLIVLYNLMINFDLKTSFMKGVLLGSFVNHVLAIGLITVPFETWMAWRYMGTTGNPNALAIIMLASIFVSIIYLIDDATKKNWFYYYQYINILFALYVILLTVSKKGTLFASVLFLFYIAISLRSKKGIGRIVILGIVASIAIYYFVDINQINEYLELTVKRFNAFSSQLSSETEFGSTGIRKRLIDFGLVTLQDKPLFGYGMDNFRVLAKGGFYSHNNFIELLVDVGLIGFTLFYSIYVYLLFMVAKMPKGDLKILFIIFIFIQIAMDMAVVSYGGKFGIYMLLFLSVYIVENMRIRGHKI